LLNIFKIVFNKQNLAQNFHFIGAAISELPYELGQVIDLVHI
jgi:hypothetical protein